ncbi:hypothetical protein [Chryseobacterium sp.]|uniref:hypothetical protein n=1 Tax=Chryseobacterium sp. TaxID=1871047 RepID=UPI0028A29DB7|nr:hypothetical protein [Chryseobacterium sp.]
MALLWRVLYGTGLSVTSPRSCGFSTSITHAKDFVSKSILQNINIISRPQKQKHIYAMLVPSL